MTWIAAGSAAVAVLLWWPPGRLLIQQRLGVGTVEIARGWLAPVVVGGVAIPLWIGLPGPPLILALTGVGVAGFTAARVRAARSQEVLRQRRREIADLLGMFAAELRAGMVPAGSLAGLSADFAFLRTAARVAELGGDVSQALREAATVPGREALAQVAAGWQIAESAGAPLAVVLGRLEETSREDREIEREVQASVAPARATGRLMAFLPVVGLLLGSGLGGSPLAVLTGTWVGALCAAAGCALACAGVAWIERIALSVERSP